MSSVPAVCSPAYIPMKLRKPRRDRFGTGSRSNSSLGPEDARSASLMNLLEVATGGPDDPLGIGGSAARS